MRSLMSLKSSTSRTTLTLRQSLSNCDGNGNCSRSSSRQLSANEAASFSRIENILVLGAGTMGSGIAQSVALSGRFTSVTLHDVSLMALSRARERILASLTRQQLKMDAEAAEAILNRINMSTRYYCLPEGAGAGKTTRNRSLLIIEAIPEVLELKQTLFRSLNSQFGRNESAIVASCSASLPREEVSRHFEAKERFAGLSFNPEPTSRMVKVIRTGATSGQTMRLLARFVADLDKVCVVSTTSGDFSHQLSSEK